MRRLVMSALGIAVVVGTFAVAPAHATCMEHVDVRGVVRVYSCAPPGGPVSTYLCVRDTCYPI